MKLTTDELYKKLAQKLEISEKICTNTKLQIEFIHQRKMKGLLRLLAERADYLHEVENINRSLCQADISDDDKLQNVTLQLEAKRKEIIEYNDIALKAAKIEQANITADLRRINSVTNLQNTYDYQWIQFSGHRLNQKG